MQVLHIPGHDSGILASATRRGQPGRHIIQDTYGVILLHEIANGFEIGIISILQIPRPNTGNELFISGAVVGCSFDHGLNRCNLFGYTCILSPLLWWCMTYRYPGHQPGLLRLLHVGPSRWVSIFLVPCELSACR